MRSVKQYWTAEENNNFDPPFALRYDPTPGGIRNSDGTTTFTCSAPMLRATEWLGEPMKALEAIANALNGIDAGEDWQAMDGAPKDGTVILAWHTVHKCPIAIRWNEEGFSSGDETLHWFERSGTTAWPGGCFSHWRPPLGAPIEGGTP